jgi:integrase
VLLFFAGCRISEALAITDEDIYASGDTLFIQIKRLKGSKQTDPIELPNQGVLQWLGEQEGKIFDFSRFTAYRVVKKVFPDLYPHYFRMNRITKVDSQFGDATVYRLFGITATSIDHYRGKVELKEVAKEMKKEIRS